MRKTVLVLLTVLLVASACASNDGDGDGAEPSTTPAGETPATEPSGLDPAATDEDQPAPLPLPVIRPAYDPAGDEPSTTPAGETPATEPSDPDPAATDADRPVYDPAGDPVDYLHGLAVWMLESEDGIGPADPDELTAASRQDSECYASAFVSVLDPGRLAGVAAELASQDLQDGFPLDVVTDAERDRLYILAGPCLDTVWHDVAEVLSVAVDLVEYDEEQQASLAAGFEECFETLFTDDNLGPWMLEVALFDSPTAEQEFATVMIRDCGESVLAPLLTEEFVSEGLERPAAECVASRMAELMADTPDIFFDLDPDVYDSEAEAAILAEMFTVMVECDAVEDLLLQ